MKKYALFTLFTLLCLACGKEGNPGDVDYNLIPVLDGKYYGYIDKQGNYLINPQFNSADVFREGLAVVLTKERNLGFIRKDGSFLTKPEYNNVTVFHEGIAWTVRHHGFPIAINRDGKELFRAKDVQSVSIYSEGLALFEKKEKDQTSLYGFLDKKGNVVIPAKFKNASLFCNGLAAVVGDNGKCGYINKKGDVVIACQFEGGRPFFTPNRAVVKEGQIFGVIDRKGNYVIKPQFYHMREDGDNYQVSTKNYGDEGLCNSNGEIIITPQFSWLSPFENADLASATLSGQKKMGYINKKGLFTIKPQFDFAGPFLADYAVVRVDEKYGLIDTDGNYLIKPELEEVPRFFFITERDQIDGQYSTAARVDNQYLNTDELVDAFRKLFADGKLDGMSFPLSVGKVLDRYALSDEVVPVYNAWEATTINLMANANVKLILNGFFYKEVSDGWWGSKSVLSKNAKADTVILELNIINLLHGFYALDVEEAFQKAFNGRIGDFKIYIDTEGRNTLQISISK